MYQAYETAMKKITCTTKVFILSYIKTVLILLAQINKSANYLCLVLM